MGKVSPKDLDSKISTRKKKLKSSSNKYLKPGALVQLCYSKASAAAKSCNDSGKKRVPVFDTKLTRSNKMAMELMDSPKSPLLLSPVNVVKRSNLVRPMKFDDLRVESSNLCKKNTLMLSPKSIVMQNSLLRTPKTPQALPCNHSESLLESLPMDLLEKIICHLHHDHLKAVFHVSQRIREATLRARLFHFNYTTPVRSRQEMLSVLTSMPTNRWPFLSKGDVNQAYKPSPHTPKAPRHAPRPPRRTKLTEMKQISTVLFQDQTTFSPSRCIVPSVLQRPTLFKPIAPKHPRVLFYEDELCQAVAQNNLH